MIGSKIYLGDGVYVGYDGHSVVLTTENGVCVSNTIFLEPEVMFEFLRWVKRVDAAMSDGSEGSE